MNSTGQLKIDNRFLSTIALLCILLGAVWVRITGISQYFYNGDEIQFIIIAKGETLQEVWRRGLAELHPPLAHFIRHYLLLITPEVFYQRLFSVVAGIVSIFGMYKVGLQLRSNYLGLFCASCLAFLPVSVSLSITVRNYAFFMAFLSWALFYFFRYQKEEKRSDLLCYALLLFLASATHFTGFLVGAATGLSGGWRLISVKHWKNFTLLCLSFLPLFFLGLFFYFHYLAPGTAGPMWNRFSIETAGAATDFSGRFRETISGIFGYFVPLLGIVNINSKINLFLLLSSTFFLFFVYVKGLLAISQEKPANCTLFIVLWGVAIFAALANFYPFQSNRHNYYFLPFFVIPLGFLMENIIRSISYHRFAHLVAVAVIILTIFFFKKNDIYLEHGNEFSLKQKDFNAGMEFLERHLKPNDVIVAERVSAYFYFPYYKDAGKTPYDGYADVPYHHQTTVIAPFDQPSKPHSSWEPFRDNLNLRLNSNITAPESKVWFVMYGWENTEIRHLLNCYAIQPKIDAYLRRGGVLIFSLQVKTLTNFLKDYAAWKNCYADYNPVSSPKKLESFGGLKNNR